MLIIFKSSETNLVLRFLFAYKYNDGKHQPMLSGSSACEMKSDTNTWNKL